MKLRVIGCAGPYPGAGRPTSCYLLEAGERKILLDMGSGSLAALTRLTDPAELDAVCISHIHWDHVCDLMPFQYLLDRRRTRIPVLLPPEIRGTDFMKLLGPALDVRFLPDEGSVAGVEVVTRLTRHPVPNRAMRFTCEGKVFVYTGDASEPGPLTDLCRDADLLLADGAFLEKERPAAAPHMSAAAVGEMAAACGVKRLILTHLPPHTPESALLREAQASFRSAVLAEPGLCVPC